MAYGVGKRERKRKIENADGTIVEQFYEPKPGKLSSADNQVRIEYETEVKFKLIGKSGEQIKNEGLQSLSWTLNAINNKDYISYIKGKSNKACVFNTNTDAVVCSKDYSDLFD